MQIQALLLFSLLALSSAQNSMPEPVPETSLTETTNGLVSYILTYSQFDQLCSTGGQVQ
jgi:hypothetical protein